MNGTFAIQEVLPAYLHTLFTPQTQTLMLWCAFFLFICLILYHMVRLKLQFEQKYVFLELIPPYKSSVSPESTKQLFAIIHATHIAVSLVEKFFVVKKVASFEIVSSKEKGIRYIVRIPAKIETIFKKTLISYIPSLEIKETQDYSNQTQQTTIKELTLSKSFVFSLQDKLKLEESDPITYITGQMNKLKSDELLAVQIAVTPVTAHTHSSITNYIDELKSMLNNNEDITNKIFGNSLLNFIDWLISPSKKRITDLSPSRKQAYVGVEDKINQPLFETSIRLLSVSKDQVNRNTHTQGLVSSFNTFTSSTQSFRSKFHLNGKVSDFLKPYFFKHRMLPIVNSSILSVSELSVIYHFPHNLHNKIEDLVKNKSPKLPAPLSIKNNQATQDITFAHNNYVETITSIGLTLEERRRHTYIIGATGTGKTTLLTQMIYRDMSNGKGIAVVDPHGDLANKLLGVIPEERLKDVIYLNPFDINLPIGLNVLEMNQGLSESERLREKDLITSSLISIFHKLYPARYSGPRMEHILRNTVLTALEMKDPTLFTIYKLLTNKNYRKSTVEKLTDPILKDFWKQEFDSLGSYQKAEMISPITNKLGRFLTTSLTRNILNQKKSKLNFEELMNSGKILICDLSKGKIGEDTSSFLGSLIVAKIQLAAFNRVHVPQEQRKDFFLYIDEFQNFATMTFAQVLSEARKYRLNAILAHQTISQIEDKDLLKVILANVGTVISFRTSNPSDEDYILPLFSPLVEKNEISNLPSYNFYIKINALSPEDAFTGSVDDFVVPANTDIKNEIIELSQTKYGSEPEKVELEIEEVKEVKIKKPKKEIKQTEKSVRVSI